MTSKLGGLGLPPIIKSSLISSLVLIYQTVPEVEAATHQLIVGICFNSLSSLSQASPKCVYSFLVGRMVISSISTICHLKYRIEKGSVLQDDILIQLTFEQHRFELCTSTYSRFFLINRVSPSYLGFNCYFPILFFFPRYKG